MRDLCQVYLLVEDLEQSVEFYRDDLDLSIMEHGKRSAEFDTGSAGLKIEADFDAETLSEFGLTPPEGRRGQGAVIVIEVSDVDKCYARTRERGASILCEPRSVEWNRRICLLEDPNGYVIEVSASE